MSNFMYVAAAGVAILVAGGIFAGFMPAGTTGVTHDGQLFFEDLGTIGAVNEVEPSSRRIDLGSFTVEAMSPNATVHEESEVVVKRGFSSHTPYMFEVEAFKPQALYLSFIPTKASSAERLVLEVNGEAVQVDRLVEERRNTIRIPADYLQKGLNVVRMEVEDPGMAFWRTAEYRFSNFRATLEDQQNDRVMKPFRVYDYEANGFDRAELRFSMTQETVRDRPLDIAVNGRPITQGFLPVKRAEPYTKTFHANTTGLRPGENVMSFKATGDSQYPVSGASIQLYYYAESQQRTVVRDFTVPENVYNKLGKEGNEGRITYNIERIFVERPLKITLPGKEYTSTPTPGKNTLTFDQDAVDQGQNELQISTDGSYRITDFNVTLVQTQ